MGIKDETPDDKVIFDNDRFNKVCEDFKKVIEIVFSNKYPEYKEDELIELLKPYVKES